MNKEIVLADVKLDASVRATVLVRNTNEDRAGYPKIIGVFVERGFYGLDLQSRIERNEQTQEAVLSYLESEIGEVGDKRVSCYYLSLDRLKGMMGRYQRGRTYRADEPLFQAIQAVDDWSQIPVFKV